VAQAETAIRNQAARVANQTSFKQADQLAPESPAVVLVDVVVLSGDLMLFNSVRAAVGERNPVWRARTAEEAVDLLITGRCGVLLLDSAAHNGEPSVLVRQICRQFPDVVIVVAGSQDDDRALAEQVSSGQIYRFMHKPLSHKRASLFMHAAIQRHAERRAGRAQQPLAAWVPTLPGRSGSLIGLVFAIALAVLLVALNSFQPQSGKSPNADSATPAAAQPRVSEPAVPAVLQADPTLSKARAALDAGRVESPRGRNALDLFAAVLLARPDNAEAREGLRESVSGTVAAADDHASRGDLGEAWRLLNRVMQVDAHDPAALALAQRLQAEQSRALAASTATDAVDRSAPELDAADDADALAPQPQQSAGIAQRATGTPNAAESAAESATPPAKADSVAAAERQPGSLVSEPEVTPAQSTVASRPERQAADSPPAEESPAVIEEKVTQPVSSNRAVVRPDPLTPRRINRPSSSARNSGIVRSGPRSYGPPISSGHPIAGTTSSDNYLAPARVSRSALTPAKAAGGGPRLVAASELVKVTTQEPAYPARALRNGIEGWVEVEFTVTGAGDVRDMVITGSQPNGVFDDAAKDALTNWRFAPHRENGQPVPLRSVVTFRFQVEG